MVDRKMGRYFQSNRQRQRQNDFHQKFTKSELNFSTWEVPIFFVLFAAFVVKNQLEAVRLNCQARPEAGQNQTQSVNHVLAPFRRALHPPIILQASWPLALCRPWVEAGLTRVRMVMD
jgi:hypothetical protein